MNVKYLEGQIPLPLTIIEKVFEKSYSYYVAGLRMYFVLVPMFAWLVSSWLLLVITLPHLYIVYRYDNLDWLESEVEEMYSSYQPLLSEEKQNESSSTSSSSKQQHQQHQKQQNKTHQESKGEKGKNSNQNEVEIISVEHV